ncbi:MAG: T9SS type A sorting domain-containing protein [Bacteroidota bacterium]
MKTRFLLFLFCVSVAGGIVAQACSTSVTTFPYAESFEGSGLPSGWTSFGVPGWIQNVGPTITPNTGPSAASDGLAYYVAEPYRGSGSSVLLSPCYDISGLTKGKLTFDYHMFGDDMGRLIVQMSPDGGVTWNQIGFFASGDQGNQWKTATVFLGSYIGVTNFRLRFIASVFSVGNNEGDIAIDNILLEETPTCFDISVAIQNESCAGLSDGSASFLVFPTATTGLDITWSTGAINTTSISNLSPGNYSVTATDNAGCTKIKNFIVYGSQPLDGELYITPATVGNADGRILCIPSGGTPPYTAQWLDGTVGTTYGAKPAGYTEVLITDANGCTTTLYTFLPEETRCQGRLINFPYRQDFENNGLGQFKQGQDDDINWKKRTGNTPTANTGPTTAGSGNQYRYLEASNSGSPFKSGAMYTKRCLDIRTLSQPQLYFKYHMHGSEMGNLLVQLSTDGGIVWRESVFTVIGDQGNQWNEAFIDLSSFVSANLRIRIVGVTGSGEQSDIAIDDVRIKSANTPLLPFVATGEDMLQSTPSPALQTTDLFRFFPNPATEFIQVMGVEEGMITLSVFDLSGRRLLHFPTLGTGTKINLADLESGIYLVRAVLENGEQVTQKLIKR